MSAGYRSANEARRQRRAQQNIEEQVHHFHKQRHEALMGAVAARAPLLREEHEAREHMGHTFRREAIEIGNWNNRIAKKTAKENARHDKLSENVSRLVHMIVDEMDLEADYEYRRHLEAQEDKCRHMIWRIMAHDRYLLDCMFAQRRLIRAEARIRECYENDELKVREEYQLDYDKKPWQPYSQLFGICPFHKKTACPFVTQKKQRLLHSPIDPDEHYCRSQK